MEQAQPPSPPPTDDREAARPAHDHRGPGGTPGRRPAEPASNDGPPVDGTLPESYEEYCRQLIFSASPAIAAGVFAAALIYGLTEWALSPTGFRAASWVYGVQLVVPVLATWLVRGPLRQRAGLVMLGADITFTATLAVLLTQPTTTASGAALFFAIKMLATALFFPWPARMQYWSTGLTLGLYWGLLATSGRHFEPATLLHQVFGPLVAALWSVIGARIADRTRRQLFLRDAAFRRDQQEHQVIFDSVPALIWYKDAEDRIVRINRTAAALLGRPAAAIEGRPSAEGYPDDSQYRSIDEIILRTGVAQRGLIGPLHTADGERRLIRADRIPYRDPHGTLVGVLVFAEDITARAQAEAALGSSTERLEEEVQVSAALAQVGRALISTVDTSEVFDRLCKLTRETLRCDFSHVARCQPDTDMFETVSVEGVNSDDWQALRTVDAPRTVISDLLAQLERNEVAQFALEDMPEGFVRLVAQRIGLARTLIVALRRGGTIFGTLTAGNRQAAGQFSKQQERIALGIAQLASLALENARLVEELERANGIKLEFVATMSHELRTPLNSVIGYNDLLLDGEFGPVNDEQTEVLQRVGHSAHELLQLINATLDLSRLEAGRALLDLSDVQPAVLLTELAAETQALQTKPDVQCIWDVAPDLPTIRTDAIKLKVVLKNLFTNALKFTERGSVTVAARCADGGLEVSVIDTGIGIPADTLPLVFQAFRQADSSTTRRYGGVGLGLYIVHRLLDMLGGDVRVDSTAGVGSTFRVWVPAAGASRSLADRSGLPMPAKPALAPGGRSAA